jgi:polysaccharide pyruvyl transferase WcaK-like protein
VSAIQPPHLTVAFIGEFGTGNFGNDASLLAAVAALRAQHPDVDVLCLCNAPNEVERTYGLSAMAIRRHTLKERSRRRWLLIRVGRRAVDLVRIYKIMRQVDVLIVPGTGVLEAGSKRAGSFLSMLLMSAIAARATRTRVAVLSVGAHPADRRATRAVIRWTLKLATYRSFRDVHSRRSATSFGALCDSDPIYPDLVFGLDIPDELVMRNDFRSVGVGLIDYRAAFFGDEPTRRDAIAAAYLACLTSFVNWLLDRGLQVTLLTGDWKDEDIAEMVLEGLDSHRSDRTVAISRPKSFNELLENMRQVDCVVVSRFHNIIAATLITKPTISIDYKTKNGELMSDMGLGRFHQPLEHLDGELLKEQFIDLERSASEVVERMAKKKSEYRNLVAQQWSLLRNTILDTTK